MGGPLSFQEKFALPTLREVVEALDALGVREYDRGDRRFTPPRELLEPSRPMADMLGITPLVALMFFMGGSFSEWAMSRIYDAAWESVKAAFRLLLNRRAEDPPTLDRPLTLVFEFWLQEEQATTGCVSRFPRGTMASPCSNASRRYLASSVIAPASMWTPTTSLSARATDNE
jgi:hypothetical protein